MAGDPTGVLLEKDAQEMLRDNKIMGLMKKTQAFNEQVYAEALKDYEAACKVWGMACDLARG